MPLFRPTFCEINLSALKHNFRELKKCAQGREVLAVVKANAYGHGAVHVARALVSEGASSLGVALVEEGIELRKAGIGVPILCFGGALGAEVSDLQEYGLTPLVFNSEGIEKLASEVRDPTNPLGIHLKVDTGMGRLGILPEQLDEILNLIGQSPSLKLQGVMTHLARAEEVDASPTEEQWNRFRQIEDRVTQAGFTAPVFHVANSSALIDGELDSTQWVRLGIALYGAYPHPRLREKVQLQPVMTWKTQIISLKEVPAQTPISYGATFKTARTSRIAVIPLGYADGYSRAFSNRGEMLVRGKKVPVVGRVCMDLTMLDVTEVKGVCLGDEVVVIGEQEGARISAEALAEKIDTIPYDIFCSITARVPRIAVSG